MKHFFRYYKEGIIGLWNNTKYNIVKKILITISSVIWYPFGYVVFYSVANCINKKLNKYEKQGFDKMNDIYKEEMNK